MADVLNLSSGDHPIQAVPLKKGNVNKTSASGTLYNTRLIYCVVDGSIDITWDDATVSTIVMYAGDSFSIGEHTSLVIVAGTFHVA